MAYFCAEFGLHASVPIYSGGLGVLAGDHCKTASDLAVPFVGIGLFYRKGYFDQQVSPDGWQEDSDEVVDPDTTPLIPLDGPDGQPWLTVVESFGRSVHVRVWTMTVGRAPIYLLDTATLPSGAMADNVTLRALIDDVAFAPETIGHFRTICAQFEPDAIVLESLPLVNLAGIAKACARADQSVLR